jgi:hypothetical protein
MATQKVGESTVAKEIFGDCWKDLEGRSKPQQRDLKTMKEKD